MSEALSANTPVAMHQSFTWDKILLLVQPLDLSDVDTLQYVSNKLNKSPQELSKGIEIAKANGISPNAENSKAYEQYFDPARVKLKVPVLESSNSDLTVTDPALLPPETASRPTKVKQKRGRKGDKVKIAYMAIPYEPVNLDTFCQQYNVSANTMRQHNKRFVKETGTEELGVVVTKKIEGVTHIWREQPNDKQAEIEN